jgi:hypothetical protein
MQLLAVLASAALLAAAQVPPYATPAHETTLAGTIAGFDGKYHLRLRDDRGYFDDITLHQGTIITPTGQRLAAGMRVTIRGAADGNTFDADEIDVFAEDATVESQGYYSQEYYSAIPYTPLIGSPVLSCNTWDCRSYGYYPGYYNGGYTPGFYGSPYSPYYGVPPVIVVPAQPNAPPPTPEPFRRRRPLDVPQQRFYAAPVQPMPPPVQRVIAPPAQGVMPAPVYRAPAPPPQPLPQPHVMPHVVNPLHH